MVVSSLVGIEILLSRGLKMDRLDLGPKFSHRFTRTEVPGKRAQTAEFVSFEIIEGHALAAAETMPILVTTWQHTVVMVSE